MIQPLFLVGPRGCGKTTVGKALADALERRFVDTDQWLQANVQMTVADIVEREGWAGFRARKQQLLKRLPRQQPLSLLAEGLFSRNKIATSCAITEL